MPTVLLWCRRVGWQQLCLHTAHTEPWVFPSPGTEREPTIGPAGAQITDQGEADAETLNPEPYPKP